jgi:peptidoglycan/xylan/chitin deacetylase (PgdA/CDA1 family)
MRRALAAAAVLALVGAGSIGGAGRVRPVPILMYHVIATPPAGAANPGLFVPARDFAGQMGWLARHGYQAVTLQRVFDFWRGAATLPARPIVLSFDDGYLSQLRNAAPILRQRRWPGVLNLEVANEQPVWGIRPPGIRKLIHFGWEIDAHTLTHPDLTTLDAARLHEEVTGSRKSIRTQFHVPVDFFCYPSGRFDATVVAAVKAAGFLGATTTVYGLARPQDLYTLDRVRIDGGDGVRAFAVKLEALGGR